MRVQVCKALEADRQAISDVVMAAFGDVHGRDIADLITELLADPTAQPLLSLVGTSDHRVVGHVLFTSAHLEHAQRTIRLAILAPLSVHPDFQCQGIGGRLIGEGRNQLRAAGVDLVFVLGYPEYYRRHGFSPAGALGFDAPYPIAPENADAWMVQELHPGVVGQVRGKVKCAEALDKARHWRE
jgi:predicted N-acetyltransferase YhbS